MEFWGIEVKSGVPVKVCPGDGMVVHLSQACIGELKNEKGNESVYMFLHIDGKKLVLGTLFSEKLPQQQFDLVFDREFELSHNFKSGSVFFYGYKANNPYEDVTEEESDEPDSEDEEDKPLPVANNGKPEFKPKQEKAVEAAKANEAIVGKRKESGDKQKVKIVEPKKDADAERDDESSDEDLMSEDDDEDDSQDDDHSESDEESADSDEETPKKLATSSLKAEPSKRPAESAPKTPVPTKKAKATPQKTDGKKPGGHIATPHPAKQAAKTPANKPNQQTPKSGGSHSCKSCERTFTTAQGLDSHTKAKHAGGK